MISPHTPPGTKVVCIRANGIGLVHKSPSPLIKGGIYRVLSFSEQRGQIWVMLDECGYRYGFNLDRFRRLDLPESLTSLLNVAPVEGSLVATSHDPQSDLRPVMVLPHHDTAGGASRKFVSPAFYPDHHFAVLQRGRCGDQVSSR